jgi:hypothetical protein
MIAGSIGRPAAEVVGEEARRMHLPGVGIACGSGAAILQSRIVPIVVGWCVCSKFTARLLFQVAMVISSNNIY